MRLKTTWKWPAYSKRDSENTTSIRFVAIIFTMFSKTKGDHFCMTLLHIQHTILEICTLKRSTVFGLIDIFQFELPIQCNQMFHEIIMPLSFNGIVQFS